MPDMKLLMVLNDGETFTDLNRCCIIGVPDAWDTDEIEDAIRNRQALLPFIEFYDATVDGSAFQTFNSDTGVTKTVSAFDPSVWDV